MLFNLIIDPFDFFESPKIKGVNQYKYHDFSRFVGSYNMTYRTYDTIIIGSSRSRSGVRPCHHTLRGQRVYNYSMPKPALNEIFWTLKKILAKQKIKEVIIALDYTSFYPKNDRDNRQHHMMFNPNVTWFSAAAKSLLTYTAVKQSVTTLERNYQQNPRGRFVQGYFAYERNIPNILDDLYRRIKHYSINDDQCDLNSTQRSHQKSYLRFQEMLRFLADRQIKVTVYTNPVHAFRLVALDQFGQWEPYLSWLEQVAKSVFLVQQQTNADLRLFNFAGFNAITTEPLPPPGQPMRYFYEVSHYKPQVGDQILNRIYGRSAVFGVELTTKNLSQQLEKMTEDKSEYYLQQQDMIKKIHTMLTPLKRQQQQMCLSYLRTLS